MKKKYVLYPGCLMPTEQYAYELSLREILPVFDIELVDIDGFSCCGEPMKSVNQLLTVSLAARNLAIAESEKRDLFVPCSMCHLSLSECQRILKTDESLKQRINTVLAEEGLIYHGSHQIVHTVELFYDHIGLDRIKEKVKHPLTGLKLVTHPGCHLIRPSEVGRPDHAENPQKMEKIIEALGAQPVHYYPQKLDCCGAPLLANLPESALTKTGQKLAAIQQQGYDGVVDVCPWCHKMMDARQTKAGETVAAQLDLPVVYLTQLIGLALGISSEKLGLQLNLSPVEKLKPAEKKKET
ncbi:MAG: CoB--CoM heterodisulfide reductase iron-sulfur subunit B family protein [Candidatus Thermoplasmatota archaeon]